ncbi:MAG: hypothetical protein M3R14_12905 [Acidobacteriota bacterium]|nr:hypothetical protein [Acidobacteriota bacterium]
MEELLKQMMGKKVDISCGTNATFSGEVVDIKGGILYLRDDEERVAYVSIERVAIVWEVKEQQTRPGFVS